MTTEDKPAGGMYARLQAAIDLRERAEGFSPADLLELDDDMAALVQAVARAGRATAADVTERVGLPQPEVEKLLGILVQKGYLTAAESEGETVYAARFGQRRGRFVPGGIWASLGALDDE